MEALKLEIQKSVLTGFVDSNNESLLDYRPSIVTNEPILNEKVLTTIIDELKSCESFFLSVAFITSGGVASLLGTLLDLQAQGIKGKILVSEYLNFTEPEALRKLLQLDNVELKIARETDFHSKGFLFTHKAYYTIIIGSSNLTHGALTKNKEWNLKVTAHKDSELFQLTISEFDKVFESAFTVNDDYLTKYAFVHNSEKKLRQGLRKALLNSEEKKILPNQMQLLALSNLKSLRDSGKTKALLVSATGTGKTFLSAFDVANFKPKRLLFLVHRRNIAQKAMESFQQIIGNKITMGLYSGNQKNSNAEYIFSTVQTFSRDEHLQNFNAEHFDYIVIDETHRASAKSYQKILDYYKPKFLLGMTATPERTDGLDVFSLFDYNIAFEIRLHDALEQEMLVPFHYYGVSDIEVDGQLLGDSATLKDLNRNDRVNHIIDKIQLFGTDDGITRGLIFCSKNEESEYLSNMMNDRGYKTIALSSASSEDERSRAIDLLETDDLEIKLDYIFTVDIFNEGIDIPRVNQIVMLRPTQSAIIFVQQLGRGLRKREGKSYVTVIDFIGNYQNNFLVPIALFGDKSYVKDNLRKLVNQPEKSLTGASTIYFDRVVKERIFHSIDTGKLQTKRKLVEEFILLKGKIGRIPTMMDFINHGERDPYQYVINYDSYYAFLLNQKESIQSLDSDELQLINFLSKEVLNPIRFLDIHLFQFILTQGSISIDEYFKLYKNEFNVLPDKLVFDHVIHHVNGGFITVFSNGKKVSLNEDKKIDLIKVENGLIKSGLTLEKLLEKEDLKNYLLDLCTYSFLNLKKQGDDYVENNFILNQKYTRKDVCRILKWDKNLESTMYGYMVKDNHAPLFVNYHKKDVSNETKYEDEFIELNRFKWFTRHGKTIHMKTESTIINSLNNDLKVLLFVQKHSIDNENRFYYFGELNIDEKSVEQTTTLSDKGDEKPIVKIEFNLKTPLKKEIFDYLKANI